jgi:photosystem II stability/assembly factor-like uncharacterized protein
MTSASTGWALLSTASPSQSSRLDIARTSDAGKTWSLITPAAARADLSSGQALLHAMSNERAWVVGVASQSSVVFGTTNGGRSWWRSSQIASANPVAVNFAGPDHGLLLASLGAAMGQEAVQVYRSADGGHTWSLAAQSAQQPGEPPSSSGLPIACDKSAVAASPAGTAWITGFCAGLADTVLVSRDDGAHWISPPLPIPPTACQQGGCQAAEPQFAGNTTFLILSAYPDDALLLVTTDGGTNWRTIVMPAGAGVYPRVQFFGPADAIAVSASAQGSIGPVFYRTSDGGQHWTAVAQGRQFGHSGPSFDFLSPAAGFAWVLGAKSSTMYQTGDSGHTWVAFTPRLG